jgi:phosphatidylserine/phosphatidylglycerophosphate/cardiolipin synthase-like enzyme
MGASVILIALIIPLSLTGATPAAAAAAPLCTQAHAQGGYTIDVLPASGASPVISVIDGARTSLELEMYELSDPGVVNAIIGAHKRHVNVTVVLDRDYTGGLVNARDFASLKRSGVKVYWGPANTIVHAKFVVADATCALIGTGNLTPQYYASTRDYWVADTNRAEVSSLAATVLGDTKRVAARPDTGHLLYSPDSESKLLSLINAATTSIQVESEEMDEPYVASALEAAAKRGVSCEILMTQDSAYDNELSALKSAGCVVKLYPNATNVLYIHAKAMIVDASTPNAQVFVGSENDSVASLIYDREVGLVLDNADAPKVLSTLESTFNADFSAAPITY